MNIYNTAKKKILDAGINFGSGTIKAMLLTDDYVPNLDTDEFLDDINGNELANGNGYTTGGATLAGKSTTVDTTDNEGVFDANDVTFTLTAQKVFRYLVLYLDSGNAATSPLIAVEDVGAGGITAQAGTLTFQWNAEGIINLV